MLHITYTSVYCCRLSFTVVVVSVFETENKCRALSACTETNSNTLTHIPQKPKSSCMRHFSKRLSFDLMIIGLREIEYSTAIWFPIKFDECPFAVFGILFVQSLSSKLSVYKSISHSANLYAIQSIPCIRHINVLPLHAAKCCQVTCQPICFSCIMRTQWRSKRSVDK